jgi:hypothetical protein
LSLQFEPTLCAPTSDILCFGCCPPIRPQHYDPLDWVASLRREFLDNRRRFLQYGPNQQPIVGFSCWALGYLDVTGRRIGCLLHPEQHQGQDLRSATGYGDKCRRERCLPAKAFDALTPEAQTYWLEPAGGLCAFYYSSNKANPLFHILLWGAEILEPLCRQVVATGAPVPVEHDLEHRLPAMGTAGETAGGALHKASGSHPCASRLTARRGWRPRRSLRASTRSRRGLCGFPTDHSGLASRHRGPGHDSPGADRGPGGTHVMLLAPAAIDNLSWQSPPITVLQRCCRRQPESVGPGF